ncbi:GatB/YqeY domain-containing protein [Bacillaceae bacterium]
MSFIDRLNEDMKQAMKNKDKLKLSVIRMVKASLQNEAIERQRELSDDEVLAVLNREVKKRKDSLQEFAKAGRDDLAANVAAEIEVLQQYLPEQLSEEEIRRLVKETIEQVGAASKADIGKVMGAIMPKVRGRADGSLVNKIVQEQLG